MHDRVYILSTKRVFCFLLLLIATVQILNPRQFGKFIAKHHMYSYLVLKLFLFNYLIKV
jgi:hypothetical protein